MDSFLIFDWYSAAVDADIDYIQLLWREAFPTHTLEPAKPRNGYTHGDLFLTPLGEVACTFMYGGDSQGSKVNCAASGAFAEPFATWVRAEFPDHELVRADVALDFDEGGAWVTLAGWGLKVGQMFHIKNQFIGAAGTELIDSPEIDGRTLYLGSRSSVGMVRIYEKGKKDNPDHPDWVRVELEFKPKGPEARKIYAKSSKLEIISAVKWVSKLFLEVGITSVLRPCAAGSVRALTTHEKTLRHLRKQYKNFLLAELERCDGSYELLGLSLLDCS